MELELHVAEGGSTSEIILGVCAKNIVSAREYQLIAEAISLASDVMYLESLPITSDGCLFRWRLKSEHRNTYMDAFESVFKFMGIPLSVLSR